MEQATTRLRRTFQYPSDDSPSTPTDMDEQEQDQLLTSLRATATSTDTLYTTIFTLLPLIAALPFLYPLLITLTLSRLPASLLGVASLAMTAYTTSLIPPSATARAPGQPWYMPFCWPQRSASQWIHQILPWINLGVCAVLALGGYVAFGFHSGGAGFGDFGLLLLVPGVMFGVVSVVRQSMADVERGVGELEGMRYEYKGA